MTRPTRRGRLVLLAALPIAACWAPRPSRDLRLQTRVDTLVAGESGLIGATAGLAVNEHGAVYLLDNLLHHVLVVSPGGGVRRTIGRRGAGPGEFNGPVALVVGRDTLRVADFGNARIQVFSEQGKLLRSDAVSERILGSNPSLAPGGQIAFATFGQGDATLARISLPGGRLGQGLGRRVDYGARTVNYRSLKAQIARGEIPREVRDNTRPLLSADGGAWLVLLANPAVARYGADGRERWTRRLEAPEVAAIRERFFRVNRALKTPSAYFGLSYVADVAEAAGRLWLLLDTGPEGNVVVLVVDGEGKETRRLTLAGVSGARRIAVDPARRRLLLALASADLVSVGLPPELLGDQAGSGTGVSPR